jgi:hypothetical protein
LTSIVMTRRDGKRGPSSWFVRTRRKTPLRIDFSNPKL